MTGSQSLTAARAALERGRGVVFVLPPSAARAGAIWELRTEGLTLVVTSDCDSATEWAAAAPAGLRLHPVTGLDRTIRLLGEGAIDALAGTPDDLSALVAASALKLEAVSTLILAWPESSSSPPAALDTLVTQIPEARRIVLTWNPRAIEAWLERHAPRAHMVGDLPLDADGRPLRPVGPARYVVAPPERRPAVARQILDAVNRPAVLLWTIGAACPRRADAVVCLDLPSYTDLQTLSGLAPVPPVVLVSAGQLGYLRSIAAPLSAFPLPGASRQARTASDPVRAEIGKRLEAGQLEPELALLEPLFDRYDPALIAAAILALRREARAPIPSAPTAPAAAPVHPPEFAKIFVSVGKKDRVGAKDLVGALTRELGLAREDIGRIVVRETFSVVETVPAVAERAIKGLAATTIRSRRVQARPYREA